MSSWFVTKDGRRFSPTERRQSAMKTYAARDRGEIPWPTECNRCGQREGIIQMHNHDYADPINFLEHLCWRCHMVHHSEHFAPQQCDAYWKSVAEGKVWPPVMRSNFAILASDHGIIHPGRSRQARAIDKADAERFTQPAHWGPVGGQGIARLGVVRDEETKATQVGETPA